MKHLLFIMCIISLMVCVYFLFGEYLDRGHAEDLVIVVVTLGVSIITGFYLWKNNYFTRNKK